MNINATAVRLAALTRELASKWDQTKDSWQDAKSREFEEKYMAELLAGVNRAVTGIREVDRIISKLRNDCE
jgi:hypothetical protein